MCINFVPPVQFLQIQLLAIFALLTIYHKALPTGWLQDLHTCHCPIAMHNVQSLTCHRASHSSATSPSSLPAATTVHMSCPTSPVHSDSPLALVHHTVDKPLWGCNGMERHNSSEWHVCASTLAHAHTVHNCNRYSCVAMPTATQNHLYCIRQYIAGNFQKATEQHAKLYEQVCQQQKLQTAIAPLMVHTHNTELQTQEKRLWPNFVAGVMAEESLTPHLLPPSN